MPHICYHFWLLVLSIANLCKVIDLIAVGTSNRINLWTLLPIFRCFPQHYLQGRDSVFFSPPRSSLRDEKRMHLSTPCFSEHAILRTQHNATHSIILILNKSRSGASGIINLVR